MKALAGSGEQAFSGSSRAKWRQLSRAACLALRSASYRPQCASSGCTAGARGTRVASALSPRRSIICGEVSEGLRRIGLRRNRAGAAHNAVERMPAALLAEARRFRVRSARRSPSLQDRPAGELWAESYQPRSPRTGPRCPGHPPLEPGLEDRVHVHQQEVGASSPSTAATSASRVVDVKRLGGG